jgi:ABC-2 type transport system ATP-binding protein
LSFALALAGVPEIVFLDEPTAGVDIDGRALIRQLLGQLAERGCAVILATHELDEAERCADEVVVFEHGAVIHQSPLSTLLGSVRQIRFSTSVPIDMRVLNQHLGVTVSLRGDAYVLDGSSETTMISRIEAWLTDHGVRLTAVHAGGRRLEDAVQDLRKGARP